MTKRQWKKSDFIIVGAVLLAILVLTSCALTNRDSCEMSCEKCDLVKIKCNDTQKVDDQ